MKKLLYVVFILLIFGCSCSQNSNDIPQSDNFSLQILHFNDIHSSESFNIEITAANNNTAASAGGWPGLIQAVSSTETSPYKEIIFAGDVFQQGYPLFTYTNGRYDYDMLCRVSPTIITLGNHELYETDTGVLSSFFDYIIQGKKNCSFDIVLANVKFDNETIQNEIKPYIIKEYGQNKAAYFGLTTNDTGMNNIKGMQIYDPYETAKDIINQLKSAGINKIIAVTHLGIEQDKKLTKMFPDIDLIVGGHTHTVLGDYSALNIKSYDKNYPVKINNGSSYIVTAGYQGLILGNINVSFNKDGQISLNESKPKMLLNPFDDSSLNDEISRYDNFLLIEENTEALTEIENIYSSISLDMNKAAGETLDNLYTLKANPDYNYNDHYASSLGSVLSKSLYTAAQTLNYKVDAAFINTGALRVNIPKGTITYGLINQAAPYANDLYFVEIYGKDIITYAETYISELVTLNNINSFPCMYGTSFKYDAANLKLTEKKILVNNQLKDIDENIIYNIVISSYLYENTGVFKNNALSAEKLNMKDKEVYTDYIIKNSPIQTIIDPVIICK